LVEIYKFYYFKNFKFNNKLLCFLQKMITPLIKTKTLTDFELLDIVWALCILEKATTEHVESILNYDFLKNGLFISVSLLKSLGLTLIIINHFTELFSTLPSKIIKILNINSAATFNIPNYKGIIQNLIYH
jgi:hypothetical protein